MSAMRFGSLVAIATLGLTVLACGDVTKSSPVDRDAGTSKPPCGTPAPFDGLADASRIFRVDASLGLTIQSSARAHEGRVGLVLGVLDEATLGTEVLGAADARSAQLVELDASGAIARRLRLVSGANVVAAKLTYDSGDRSGVYVHVQRAGAAPIIVDPDGASIALEDDEIGVVMALRDGAIEWSLLERHAMTSWISFAPDGRMLLAGQQTDGLSSLSSIDGTSVLTSDAPTSRAGWLGTIDATGVPISLWRLAGTGESNIDRAIGLPDGRLVIAGRFGGGAEALTVEIPSKNGLVTLVEIGAGEDPEDDGFVALLDATHDAAWVTHLIGYPYGELDLDLRGQEVFVHQPGLVHAIVDATGTHHDQAHEALGLTLDGVLDWSRALPTLVTKGATAAASTLHEGSDMTWTSEPDGGGIVVERTSSDAGDLWLLLSLREEARIAGVRRLLLEPSAAWQAFPGCGSTWYLVGGNTVVAADVAAE